MDVSEELERKKISVRWFLLDDMWENGILQQPENHGNKRTVLF